MRAAGLCSYRFVAGHGVRRPLSLPTILPTCPYETVEIVALHGAVWRLNGRRRHGQGRLKIVSRPCGRRVGLLEVKKTGLSPRTIHHVHTCLHKACKDAVRWGRISRNPVEAADPPSTKGAGTEMKTWNAKQLKAFLAAPKDDRLSPVYHLLAMTGMRRGEVCGLRWDDVDLEAGRLAVRRALIPYGDGVITSEPKTARGRRSIALDPGTIEALKAQAARQLEDQNEWEGAWVDSGYVFTREDGEPYHPQSISRSFERAVKAAKLPEIRLHDLRHTHATLALRAGIHPKVVSERLGHATIAITLDTYSHAIPAMQEEAATLIAGLVFAGD